MRKLLLGLVGVSALAIGSAANATMIVSTTTEVSAVTGGTADGVTYNFSYTSSCTVPAAVNCGTESPTPFEATVQFINDLTGFYGFGVQHTATVDGSIVAASDVDFTDVWVALLDGGVETRVADLLDLTGDNDVSEFWSLSGLNLAATTEGQAYVIHVVGERGVSSSFDGSIHFSPDNAVPEPGTWAMMLFGFGAIGFAMRRRRRPVLAQAA